MKTIMTFEISEAAFQCQLSPEIILEFIDLEWIRPVDPKNLLLDDEDIARIKLISELQTDLGVNNDSVSIILHLIDQLNHLHLELNRTNFDI